MVHAMFKNFCDMEVQFFGSGCWKHMFPAVWVNQNAWISYSNHTILNIFPKKTMNINEPSFQNVSLRIPGWTRNKLFRVNEAVCMAGARNLKRGIFEGVFGFLGILFETSLGIRSAHRTWEWFHGILINTLRFGGDWLYTPIIIIWRSVSQDP